jgi:hypothetical protein
MEAAMLFELLLRRMNGLAAHRLRGRGESKRLRLGPNAADTFDTLRKL